MVSNSSFLIYYCNYMSPVAEFQVFIKIICIMKMYIGHKKLFIKGIKTQKSAYPLVLIIFFYYNGTEN